MQHRFVIILSQLPATNIINDENACSVVGDCLVIKRQRRTVKEHAGTQEIPRAFKRAAPRKDWEWEWITIQLEKNELRTSGSSF